MKINFFLITLSLFSVVRVHSQYSSPYSQYGLGKIADPVTSSNSSCGGISAGYISPLNINIQNPASYSNSYLTTFEVGGFMEYGSYKVADSSYASGNGGMSHLAVLLPLKSTKWGLALGIQPYSSVNLSFSSTIQDSDLKKIYLLNTDEGSMYKAFIGTGYKIKNISIGVNIGLLWGGINKKYSYFVNDSLGRSFDNINNASISAFHYNVGVQYYKAINKNLLLVLGLSGATNTKAYGTNYGQINTWQYVGNTLVSDRAKRDTTDFSFLIPGFIDFGFTLTKKNYLTLGMDFKMSNWSVMQYNTNGKPLNDNWSIHTGVEFKPINKENVKAKKYFNTIAYRAGASFGKSEQNISNTFINTYSLHLGLGLPVKVPRVISYFNLGLEVGGRGMDNTYSNESYFKFNLFLTFADKWFTRTKFE